jgi:hypothetical protein
MYLYCRVIFYLKLIANSTEARDCTGRTGVGLGERESFTTAQDMNIGNSFLSQKKSADFGDVSAHFNPFSG